MMTLVPIERLTKGAVLLLPFGRTATLSSDPVVHRTFVTFVTEEYGQNRVERGREMQVDACEICGTFTHLHTEEDCIT
jgi:hypothetical protein